MRKVSGITERTLSEVQTAVPRIQTPRLTNHMTQHVQTTKDIGALVIGGDYQGLGIIRSLGRRGIPSVVIDDEHSIGAYSRYTEHAVHCKSLREPDAVVESALSIGKRFGLEGWILFPTRDETVAAFSKARAELGNFFRVPMPHWDSVKFAWDKRNMHELLTNLKIPAPRSFNPQSVDELERIDFEPPYVLKPAIKEHFFYKTRAKAWRADSREELRQLFRLAVDHCGSGEMLIQELIPGDGRHQFSYCAFFKGGKAVASMIAQRRRQHPLEFGRASTYVVTTQNTLLESYSECFLRAIDYYGLAEAEFKFDTRDNQFKLHDVNLRTWGYHSVGPSAGVDFPYLLFRDQLGHAVDECRARAGVKWVRTVTDIPASFLGICGGSLGFSEYLRSLKGPITEAVFDLKDPLPGIVEIGLLPYLMYKRGF
jgi:D-aspartate ligase